MALAPIPMARNNYQLHYGNAIAHQLSCLLPYYHLRWRKSAKHGKLLLLAAAGIESGSPAEQASALSIRPQQQVHARKKVASSPSLNQFK